MTTKILHEACSVINKQFKYSPIVYGSLCLNYYIENHLGIKDVDLLMPIKFIEDSKDEFISAFESHGFEYLDKELLTFRKDNIDVEIARLEDWTQACNFMLININAKNSMT